MAEPDAPRDVSDAELAVLRHLWDGGPATRRRLADALYPGGGPAHYTTVQKLLERLEAKGHVRSELAGGVRVFAATVGRDALLRRRLRDVADKLCGGAVAPLVMTLVEAGPLSAADLAELLARDDTYVYVCGLKSMEEGVIAALREVAAGAGLPWETLAARLKREGRLHLETY